LFVPIVRKKFVASTHMRGADGIILDLEDSVLEAEKERARARACGCQGGWPRRLRCAGAHQPPVASGLPRYRGSGGPRRHAARVPQGREPEHLGVVAELLDGLEAARVLPAGNT